MVSMGPISVITVMEQPIRQESSPDHPHEDLRSANYCTIASQNFFQEIFIMCLALKEKFPVIFCLYLPLTLSLIENASSGLSCA